MKVIILVLGLMIVSSFLIAIDPFHQIEMAGAEGVTYCNYNNNYYAVDAEDGIIYEIDSEKNVTIFKDSLNTLMQPITIGNLIYVSSNDPRTLQCYDLDSSNLVFELSLNFAGGIGGLTYVEIQNAIYIVNQMGGLYKVNLDDNELTTISSTHAGNAICYDEVNYRLIIATWGYKLSEVDLNTMEIATISSTIAGNYTGITKSGNIYFVSHWGNIVFMYDENFSERTVLLNTNLNNPVGLCYNEPIDEFLVCNYYYNGVGNLQFYHISDLVSIQENNVIPESGFLHQNFPNPFNPETTISFNLSENITKRCELIIYNLKGQKIRDFSISKEQSTVQWDGTNSNGKQVSSGVYAYQLSVNGKIIDMKKCVLIK